MSSREASLVADGYRRCPSCRATYFKVDFTATRRLVLVIDSVQPLRLSNSKNGKTNEGRASAVVLVKQVETLEEQKDPCFLPFPLLVLLSLPILDMRKLCSTRCDSLKVSDPSKSKE